MSVHARKYDVATELANAPYGVTFDQIIDGDAGEAKVKLGRMLSCCGVTVSVNEVKGSMAECKLQVVDTKVRGMAATSLDTGAIEHVLSSNLARRLALSLKPKDKSITIPTRRKFLVLGMVQTGTVTFDTLVANSDRFFFEACPFEAVVGRPTMRPIRCCIDIGKDIDGLSCGE